MRTSLVLVLALVSACSGSIQWQECQPKACGVDCREQLDNKMPCTAEYPISAGGNGNVTALLDVEGAYAGSYDIALTVPTGVTATVTPSKAEVKSGSPLSVKVEFSVDAGVAAGDKTIQLTASAGGSAKNRASTSISLAVQ